METEVKAKPIHDMSFAENEFERLAELRDLDLDEEFMDAEELSEFKRLRRKIVKAIAKGTITIDEDARVEVSMRRYDRVNSVTFKIRDGSSMLTMDRHKESQTMHKLYGVMAAMTGTAISTFSNMPDPDLGLCESVTKLLMG